MNFKKLILVFTFFTGVHQADAQVILSTIRSYSETIDQFDLEMSREAGSDLNSSFETSATFNQLDILNVASNQGWRIAISREDINWSGAFTLSVRRNSTGTACGTCMGVNGAASPSAYIAISAVETDYIFGTGEVTGIDLQFRVEGLSLTVPAASYSTEIVYTLYGD
jgi:hypothetical protein